MKFFCLSFLFFFIFQPDFVWTPFKDFVAFVPFILLYFFAFEKRYRYHIKLSVLLEFSLMALIGTWSFYLSVLNGHEPIFFFVLLKFLFFYVVSCLFWECSRRYQDFNDVLLLISYCCCFNALIIIFQFWFPSLLIFLESLQAHTGNIDFVNRGYRLRGLAAGGAASLSLMLSLGVLCSLYLKKAQKLTPIKAYMLSFLLLYALIFVARTGFLIGIGVVLFFLLLNPKHIKYVIATSLVVFVSILIFSVFMPDRTNFFLIEAMPWAAEYLGVFKGESVRSVNELQEMLYIPPDISTLLIGAGFFEGEGTATLMRSDSGYLKTVTSVGIVLGATIYALILKWLVKPVCKLDNRFYLYLIFPLITILLVAEIKEPFFYQNYVSRFIVLLIAYQNPLFKKAEGVSTVNKTIFVGLK